MTHFGHAALFLALLTALYSVSASVWGARSRRPQWVERAGKGLCAVTGFVAVATAILLYLLLSRDFQAQYVYAHTSTYQPTLYVISSLWAGQEGSFLLWSLFLSVTSLVIVIRKRQWPSDLWPHMLTTLGLVQAFFALVLVTVQDPFTLYPMRPPEGAGLTPILENPGMVIHPPIVFLGYAAYSVPFAFTMASLVAGRMEASWVRLLRKWNLVAWLFLGLGILIGAWWAYVELGWGGYWSWDPVESASLVPWLVGTAYLHSSMAQEHRGGLDRWNVMLAIATFLLCIFSTLVTRGGFVISDLHGFSQTIQPIAYYLLGFIGTVVMLSGVLLSVQRRNLSQTPEVEHLLSRDSALLLTNMLFVGLGIAILIGILFPNTSQMLWGVRIHLSSSFYNRVFVPLATGIILLMGICPLLKWGRALPRKLLQQMRYPALASIALSVSLFVMGVRRVLALLASMLITFAGANILAEIIHPIVKRGHHRREGTVHAIMKLLSGNRRHYGACLVHLSILLMAIGITGSSLYKTEKLVSLAREDTVTIQGYTLKYEDLAVLDEVGRQRHVATIGVYQGQTHIATLKPEKNFHWNIQDYVTEVAIHTTWKEDLYVALAWPEEGGLTTFRISVYPLVTWLWIGGGLLLIGTLVGIWPTTAARRHS